MDDNADKKTPRKPPGAPFFLVAMAFYLLLVHGASLLGAEAGLVQGPPQQYPGLWPPLDGLLNILGGSARSSALFAIPILYVAMVYTFFLTRTLVGGPVWLGSLAGTCLMTHPVKTEALFSPTGLYYLIATVLALGATLAYARYRVTREKRTYGVALLFFLAAVLPFSINVPLLGVFVVLEYITGEPGERRGIRLLPFAVITVVAGWIARESLFAGPYDPQALWGPLVLLVYPIGLLPETVANLAASSWKAWLWAGTSMVALLAMLRFVDSRPLRFAVVALILFRTMPTGLPIDLVTLSGGGQLFYPAALAALTLAAFSKWMMGFEPWRQPAVALTTIVCVVLFVLQFQANRAYIRTLDEATAISVDGKLSRLEGPSADEVHPWHR